MDLQAKAFDWAISRSSLAYSTSTFRLGEKLCGHDWSNSVVRSSNDWNKICRNPVIQLTRSSFLHHRNMADPAYSALRKILLDEITPAVMVLPTPLVEERCQKNGLSFVQMLTPFCVFNNIDGETYTLYIIFSFICLYFI